MVIGSVGSRQEGNRVAQVEAASGGGSTNLQHRLPEGWTFQQLLDPSDLLVWSDGLPRHGAVGLTIPPDVRLNIITALDNGGEEALAVMVRSTTGPGRAVVVSEGDSTKLFKYTQC